MTWAQSRRLSRRLTAIAVLASLAAPGAGALAVGAHLALAAHHSHHHAHPHDAGDHRQTALELALAAVHGHDHGAEAVPHHDHPAPVTGGPSVQPSAPSAVAAVPDGSAPRALAAGLERPLSPRRGPPVPLFEANCSLLL